MRKYILGSHNSMTYLEPTSWFWNHFRFLARCQRIPYQEQYDKGVRCFDLRLWFDDNDRCCFKHGLFKYKTFSVYEVLDFINKKEDCYCRIIFECDKREISDSKYSQKEDHFIRYCKNLETLYPNIRFFGGERKFDWVKLYHFQDEIDGNIPTLKDKYSSTTNLITPEKTEKFWDILDDWWPWLYAWIHNKKNLKKFEDERFEGILLIDFVDIV